MTRIIHRYIFRDLFKVFILTTLSMTLIFSISQMLRPIQKYGVAPEQVFKLLWYFSPVMLSFVMPIAAVFAASITYGRFASDNEFDACRASGISPHSLAMPGLVLAVFVAVCNLLLNFYISPVYIDKAERSIQANAREIIFRSLERNGYYENKNGRFKIMSDVVLPEENRLLGVNILEQRKNKSGWLVTTPEAQVEIDTHRHYNNIVAVAHDAYYIDGKTQGYSRRLPVMGRFGSLLGEKVKFLKYDELTEVKDNPYLFNPVREKVLEVSDQLSAELFSEYISRSLSDNGRFELFTPARRLVVHCGGAEAQNKSTIRLLGEVKTVEYDKLLAERMIKTWAGREAFLRLDADRSWVLSMPSAVWKSPDGIEGLAADHNMRGISMPAELEDLFSEENILHTVMNEHPDEPTEELKTLHTRVKDKIVDVYANIHAEIHFRIVFAIGCISLVITGMALGIIYKGGHVLTAFGLSSIPAGFLIVVIAAGENITKNVPSGAESFSYNGIYLMWAGLGVLMLISGLVYRRINHA
ncbi:lipopolysaccharide ABC transporter permease LptF [Limihaloglobus sulfuriphilus]|uniref:Lipopolysaccharide ABC transporter permease LptF n=1 Tax=Limihaloglobus sulfuriphilus TaxID=1851148 RepID=A0A1Q2MCL9_9BACT|nr:LptF/LptG family permease [Limihaloglobus sulfuriphilus]AQQ69992.1 lipopolysaccharide ABC transporter permease LptF [Limihaloglobus sulfuriphilus]